MDNILNSGVYQKLPKYSDSLHPEYKSVEFLPNGDLKIEYYDKNWIEVDNLYIININNHQIAIGRDPMNSVERGTTMVKLDEFSALVTGHNSINGKYYATYAYFNVLNKSYHTNVLIYENGIISPCQYVKISNVVNSLHVDTISSQ